MDTQFAPSHGQTQSNRLRDAEADSEFLRLAIAGSFARYHLMLTGRRWARRAGIQLEGTNLKMLGVARQLS